MSTSDSNSDAELVRRTIKLPHPRVLAVAFGFLFEIVDAFFGRRHRRILDALARRTAELYVSDKPRKAQAFRNRLDERLQKQQLELVDWWEAGHGQ